MPVIPTGFDRGDGVTPLPQQPQGSPGSPQPFGTPDPAGAVTVRWQTPSASLEQPAQEDGESPEIERAEQATIMHRTKHAWQDAVNLITGLGRGTFLQDSFGNITRILSSRIASKRGGQANLEVVAESISFDSPPDEFRIEPADLGLDIIKHPRYSWAIAPNPTDSSRSTTVGDTVINYIQIKTSIIRLIQAYRDSPFFPSPDQVNGLIQNNIMSQISAGGDGKAYLNVQVPNPNFDGTKAIDAPVAWSGLNSDLPVAGNPQYLIVLVPVDLSNPDDPISIALAAAKEIISKLWRQEDTPYLTIFRLIWTRYFFAPQFINPGGYIEDPVGVVPDYFMSPNQDGSNTVFDLIAQINPQAYSSDGTSTGSVNISSLRRADEVEFQRTWFKVDHSWDVAIIGNWDLDLYSGANRPQNANDFDQLI